MGGIKARLQAFQQSKVGLFLKKFLDDRGMNLASLLAWGTLSTMLPLLLGVLAIAGLVLRDPARLDTVYGTITSMVPQQAAGPLGDALQNMRDGSAAPAGIVGLLLLLYNGSRLFSNMGSVFDQTFHVESRNFIVQNLIAVVMLVFVTALLLVSVVALGFGSVVDSLPVALPFGPVVGRVISWSLSIVSAIVLFLLLYKVLPNKPQGWKDVLPGALLATVLFFIITLIFPIYAAVFPPNKAYAAFGVFLVLTFWLYLLGLVLVLGAELNAFLQDPERSAALADATAKAEKGQAAIQESPTGGAEAQATGSAPDVDSRPGLLGQQPKPKASAAGAASSTKAGDTSSNRKGRGAESSGAQPAGGGAGGGMGATVAGKVLGFVGLIIAAFLLRGRTVPESDRRPAGQRA